MIAKGLVKKSARALGANFKSQALRGTGVNIYKAQRIYQMAITKLQKDVRSGSVSKDEYPGKLYAIVRKVLTAIGYDGFVPRPQSRRERDIGNNLYKKPLQDNLRVDNRYGT